MIRVVRSSKNLTCGYMNPGVVNGDGSTFDTPVVWSESSTNNNGRLDYKAGTGDSDAIRYILVTLKANTNYSFGISSNNGPILCKMYKQNDSNTVIGNYYYSDSNTITVTEDGNYILAMSNSYTSEGDEYLTLSPSPEVTVGDAGWGYDSTKCLLEGFNQYGKMIKYRTLDQTSVKFNDFMEGLLYWDSNKYSSISSYDDAVSKFASGFNGPILTNKYDLQDGQSSQIGGWTDGFIVKMKGYIKIDVPGEYKFYTNQDDQIAMRVDDVTAYHSGASGSFALRITKTLTVGLHEFEFYFAEGSGNQYYNIRWQIPGASNYTEIPVGTFWSNKRDVPEEYFYLNCPTNLSSNTSDPNWVVSASNEKYGDTQAWCAFCPGNDWRSTGGCWGSGGLPSWIRWQNLNKKVLIKRYTILSSSSYECIYNWTLEGSNNGTDWTVLDTQSLSSFPPNTTKEFVVSSNNTSYYYHRLNITSAGDSDCPIGEIKTYSKV